VWDEIARLHAHRSDVAAGVGTRKLAEETGLAELSDVMINAAVAMAGITGDTGQAARAFRRHLDGGSPAQACRPRPQSSTRRGTGPHRRSSCTRTRKGCCS
jgi:thiazole synthase ThiGH ThiG subunit